MVEETAGGGLEIRTYFVRGRNALAARAAFEPLYVDYYLHLADIDAQKPMLEDDLFKQALSAIALSAASRPHDETMAWTIHLQEPLLNLFVTANNVDGTLVGQSFAEQVRDTEQNLFFSDLARGSDPVRRSVVEFEGADIFRAVERFYAQSEQRPGRLFRYDVEDFVLVVAQPDCDLEWFSALDDAAIRRLDQEEELSLLEQRHFRWHCGCSEKRLCDVLVPTMRVDPEGLFGEETSIRVSCPRCGTRYVITREALEAHAAHGELPPER